MRTISHRPARSHAVTFGGSLPLLLLMGLGLLPTTATAGLLMTGAGAGGGPHVKVFPDSSGAPSQSFFAYDPVFAGGVHVAVGDVTGDGIPDLIVGAGSGGGPHVKVFDGVTGAEVRSFFAYDPAFTGGVFVAAGDVTGDGVADIVTGAGPGGGPHVKVFDGSTGTLVQSFFAYNPAFTGGVRVAAGDVTDDGVADVVTGAGPGGGPHVKVYDGVTGAEVRSFFAYDPAFTGGVFVAAGDVTGDGVADLVIGPGAGGGPHVRVLDGVTNYPLHELFAYDPAFAGGVSVGAGDVTGDGVADVITGAGPGGGPHVRVFDGPTGLEVGGFFAYDPLFAGGVFVAGNSGLPVGPGSTPTTTVVIAAPNPTVFGQPVTFTATVTAAAGTPTGLVTFRDGATSLGTSLLAGGQASLTVSSLTTGAHAITAEYGGNPTFAVSSGSLTQNVDPAATSVAISSSANPSVFGQAVTFTATVSATPPGAGTPTGTVTFTVDGVPQAPITLAGGEAAFTTSALAVGNRTIAAQYSGDANFQTSTSPDFTQTVNQVPTSTVLISSLNPSGIGQAVTFTATVTSGAGTPTGSVEFFDGGASLGIVPLAGGQAQLTTSSLTAGPHSITAVYGGDPSFLGSTSPIVGQQVIQVAVDDGFPATGNIAIQVAAPGVLANDFAGSTVTQVQGSPAGVGSPVATAQSGTVTVDAGGSFTYDPPAGVTGTTDTFTYQATTGGGAASTATVTITLTDILWFVCDSCGGTSAGTLLHPYTSTGAFTAANTGPAPAPQPGHKVYIRSGTYDGVADTLTLRAGQQVWGQGVAASTVITPAPNTHPGFAALGAGTRPIIAPTSNNGINLSINNGVQHLDVANVAAAATKLAGNPVGNLTVSNVSLGGTGGALNLANGTLTATFDGIASTISASTGISLAALGGSLTVLPSGTTVVTNSSGTAAFLNGNTATIDLAGVLLAPANGQRGLHATDNSGTLTVAGGTIATVNDTAVEITHSSGSTPLSVVNLNVSASGGPNGIVLQNTSGSFAVIGGTIQGTLGADGAVAGNGVHLSGVTGVALANMTISNHQNHAIRGVNVAGFTLTNSTVSGVNGTNPALDEGSVRFDGLVGSASITGALVEGGVKDNVRVLNTSGALNPLTVSGGTIGLNGAVSGNDGILILAEGTATVVATVAGVSFLGAGSDLFQANALGSATLNVTLQDNSFQNAHPSIVSGGGGVTIGGGDATSNINVTYNISGTSPGAQSFRQAKGNALTVNFVNGGGTAIGTIQNNAIGQAGVEGSASTEGSGISIGGAGTVAHTVTINGNTIRGVGTGTGGFAGIEVLALQDSAVRATLTNNTLDEFAGLAVAGIYLLTGGDLTDDARMCADVQNNVVDASDAAGSLDLLGDYIAGTSGFPGFAGATGGAALDALLSSQNTFSGNGVDTSAITGVNTATVCP